MRRCYMACFLGLLLSFSSAIAAGRLWDPLIDAVPNLVALYDSSDGDTVLGSVSDWLDKSANGYHLDDVLDNNVGFDGLPHINGLTAVSFGYIGYIQRTGIPDINLTDGVCLISVGLATGGDTHHYGSTSSTNGSSSIYIVETGSGTMNARVLINGLGSDFNFNSTNYIDGVPFMCAAYYDPAGMAYLRGNGGADTASSARDAGATYTINGIKLGRLGNTAGHYHGEMVLLNTADIDTIEEVEGYLAWKWGIQDKLPTDHPYKNAAPFVPPAGTVITLY